jgi:hypothetical protein
MDQLMRHHFASPLSPQASSSSSSSLPSSSLLQQHQMQSNPSTSASSAAMITSPFDFATSSEALSSSYHQHQQQSFNAAKMNKPGTLSNFPPQLSISTSYKNSNLNNSVMVSMRYLFTFVLNMPNIHPN